MIRTWYLKYTLFSSLSQLLKILPLILSYVFKETFWDKVRMYRFSPLIYCHEYMMIMKYILSIIFSFIEQLPCA